jgi:hypothetical protein
MTDVTFRSFPQAVSDQAVAVMADGWSKITSARNYEKEAGTILFLQ